MTTMASSYFTITPTSGTGNGTVRVTPTGNNMTITDRAATVSINGQNVAIRQWGIPSISRVGGQEPVSAPASGATYQYLVNTHYQVQFCNKPDWITIDDGQGNYITSAQTIAANVANGKTYNFTVLPNTDNNSRETPANFGLWHYLHSTLQQNYDEVSISQPAGAEDYIVITSTSSLDWDDTNAKVINISANVPYSVSNSNDTDFTLNGGNGYVTIRANATNTGTTLKTTTISVVSTKSSFHYTATCVVTQYRRPRINVVGGSTVPNTGGTVYVEVNSDYYWWLSPTVSPDTNAYYEYISMSAKTADMNMAPVPTTHTYSLDFDANNGVSTRNVSLYVGYLKLDNSTTGRSSQSASFSQDTVISDTLTVTPSRIPETGYASSGGGVYTLQVTTSRIWGLNSIPSFCTVSPTGGTGDTTVTVTIPPATHSGSSYRVLGTIYFVTMDGGLLAEEDVPVYQYENYVAPTFVVVQPEYLEISSASNSFNYSVSASTDWTAGTEYPWITLGTPTTGTSGYTTGLTFTVSQNDGAQRDASIIVTAGTKYDAVSIRQASAITIPDSIVLSSTGASVDSGSSVIRTIDVTASKDWSLSTNVNWLRWYAGAFDLNPMISGTSGTTTIYRRIDENSGSSRTGTTTFTCGTASTTYVVQQAEGYVEPTPVGNLEFDPPQISPASRSYDIYEVECYNGTDEDYSIDYGDDWVQFYDGPDPSTADAISVIPNNERLVLYLEVQAGSNRNVTITFTGDDSGTVVGFYVNQP